VVTTLSEAGAGASNVAELRFETLVRASARVADSASTPSECAPCERKKPPGSSVGTGIEFNTWSPLNGAGMCPASRRITRLSRVRMDPSSGNTSGVELLRKAWSNAEISLSSWSLAI